MQYNCPVNCRLHRCKSPIGDVTSGVHPYRGQTAFDNDMQLILQLSDSSVDSVSHVNRLIGMYMECKQTVRKTFYRPSVIVTTAVFIAYDRMFKDRLQASMYSKLINDVEKKLTQSNSWV